MHTLPLRNSTGVIDFVRFSDADNEPLTGLTHLSISASVVFSGSPSAALEVEAAADEATWVAPSSSSHIRFVELGFGFEGWYAVHLPDVFWSHAGRLTGLQLRTALSPEGANVLWNLDQPFSPVIGAIGVGQDGNTRGAGSSHEFWQGRAKTVMVAVVDRDGNPVNLEGRTLLYKLQTRNAEQPGFISQVSSGITVSGEGDIKNVATIPVPGAAVALASQDRLWLLEDVGNESVLDWGMARVFGVAAAT